MKKIILLFLVNTFSLVIFAQLHQVSTQNATVFRQGVQLKQTVSFTVKAGVQEVVLFGLAQHVEEQSIRLKASSNQVQLMGMRLQQNFLEPEMANPIISKLSDSLILLRNLVGQEKRLQEATKLERELLYDNRKIAGEEKGLAVLELEKMVTYYRKKMDDNIKAMHESGMRETELTHNINRIQNQINQHRATASKSRNELVLDLNAKEATKITFELQYFSSLANWQSKYEMRATDGSSTLSLVHNAAISQNTGIDWNQISVSLSTGNPMRSTVVPNYQTWPLSFYQPMVRMMDERAGMAPKVMAAEAKGVYDMEIAEVKLNNVATPTFTTEENSVATIFETGAAQSLPNGQNRTVRLQVHNLPVAYRHFTYPRMQQDVFLQAMITQYEQIGLTAGPLTLFLDDNFVGNSYFNPLSNADTLEISFGIDEKVSVKYEMLLNKSSKAFIGSNVTRDFAKQISLKNNRKSTIDLVVIDQLPISTDKEIEVKGDANGAKFDELSGKLTYQIKLDAGKSTILPITYKVKHPKNKTVTGL